jgi:hypothetical protein
MSLPLREKPLASILNGLGNKENLNWFCLSPLIKTNKSPTRT